MLIKADHPSGGGGGAGKTQHDHHSRGVLKLADGVLP